VGGGYKERSFLKGPREKGKKGPLGKGKKKTALTEPLEKKEGGKEKGRLRKRGGAQRKHRLSKERRVVHRKVNLQTGKKW